MSPEHRGVPKVEFIIIFLFLALFQLAHFFITPSIQYSIITSTVPIMVRQLNSLFAWSLTMYLQMIILIQQCLWTSITFLIWFMDWLNSNGIDYVIILSFVLVLDSICFPVLVLFLGMIVGVHLGYLECSGFGVIAYYLYRSRMALWTTMPKEFSVPLSIL